MKGLQVVQRTMTVLTQHTDCITNTSSKCLDVLEPSRVVVKHLGFPAGASLQFASRPRDILQ